MTEKAETKGAERIDSMPNGVIQVGSTHPTVNGTGQIAWSVRDVLFSKSRIEAAETIEQRTDQEAEPA